MLEDNANTATKPNRNSDEDAGIWDSLKRLTLTPTVTVSFSTKGWRSIKDTCAIKYYLMPFLKSALSEIMFDRRVFTDLSTGM